MESNFTNPSPDEARSALNELSTDRERLAANVEVPWALLAALGAMGAWWVSAAATSEPGANYEASSTSWLALVGALVIISLIQRETGMRFRTMGSRANWAVAGIVVACLVLFSVSLGFVSFGLHWAVALTSVAAFAVTTWLAGIAYRSAAGQLRSE